MTDKIDFVYANGCSWTHGNGITDDPVFNGNPPLMSDCHRMYTWPARLAEILCCDHINDSMGAGSNQRILRTTTEFLRTYPATKRSNLLVVIGWTSLERDEIFLNDAGHQQWVHFNAGQDIETGPGFKMHQYPSDMVTELKRYQHIHRKYVQHTYSGFVNWANQLYLLSNTMENLGVRFLFFSSIGGWRWGNGINMDLNEKFSKEFELFDDPRYLGMMNSRSMTSFCLDNGIPLSKCRHPMIEGHRAWAGFLHEKIQEIY